MEYVKLNNGVLMPKLGFGVCGYKDLQECEDIVYLAIKNGYRLIDTASIYGNEEAVGKAIKRVISDGICKREDLFIISKLWVSDNGYQEALKAFDVSLSKLQLDYLDLYLIHRPLGDYYGSYRALEKLYHDGKIKAIGVSNFFDDRLYDLMYNTEVKPAINQIQSNPFLQRNEEISFHQEVGVVLQAWSPLASGKNNVFENILLKELADKYQKSVAQIILRWHLQRGFTVVFKSKNEMRMKDNMNIFDFKLSKEDMQKIKLLDLGIVEDSKYRLESLKRVYGI